MTWTRTCVFPSSEHSHRSVALTESTVKEIKLKAEQDDKERIYVNSNRLISVYRSSLSFDNVHFLKARIIPE